MKKPNSFSGIIQLRLFPNIRELLGYLHDNSIRTGVISNIGWTGAALKRRINTLLPDHHFEFILASSDYGLRKPDKRLFQVALEKAALKPNEVWFCGDTYDKDIEGACAAGIYAFFYQGFADGSARQPLLNNINTHIPVISDWNDFIQMLKRS